MKGPFANSKLHISTSRNSNEPAENWSCSIR